MSGQIVRLCTRAACHMITACLYMRAAICFLTGARAKAAIAAILVGLLAASPAFAATVSMNFRFHISGLPGDLIHVNETSYLGQSIDRTFRHAKPYISSEAAGALAVLAFAGGGFLGIRLDTTSDPYLFQMTQEEIENRFLIALTEGTWPDIDSLAAARRVPRKTFGNLETGLSNPQNIFARLQYDTLFLTGAVASGQLLVKNLGNRKIGLELIG